MIATPTPAGVEPTTRPARVPAKRRLPRVELSRRPSRKSAASAGGYLPDEYQPLMRSYRESGPLTAEEERELSDRRDRGCVASRNALIERAIPLAIALTHRHWRKAGRASNFDDLVGAALVGLAQAADAFEPSRGTRFGTVAQYWILRNLTDYRTRHEPMIRVPRDVYWAMKNDRAKTGKRREWDDAIGAARAALKVYFPGPDDGWRMADHPAAEPVEASDRADLLHRALAEIDPRQALVVREAYGLDGESPRLQKDIADRQGMTRYQVSDLLRAGLGKLRFLLQSRGA